MTPAAAACATEIILLDHHPDLLRRPQAAPGGVDAGNRRAALTWNVFRTLELIAPAFWLRRFRARLGLLTSVVPADRSLAIRLWTDLPTPLATVPQEPVRVDALVETDRAVYGIITFDGSDLKADMALARPDVVLRTIDAVSWHAGVRDAYIALITSDPSDAAIATVLVDRYRASRDMLLRRLSHRRDGLANVRGIGRMTWRDAASIIRDCAASHSLTDLERFAASRTAMWLESAGISPAD